MLPTLDAIAYEVETSRSIIEIVPCFCFIPATGTREECDPYRLFNRDSSMTKSHRSIPAFCIACVGQGLGEIFISPSFLLLLSPLKS